VSLALPQTIPFLGWQWDDLLFLLFAATMLGSGLMVVLGRNIIRSGLWMIASFASLAGLYVLLGAPLVAAAQVLVYIGAISVLVLFAIMLTQSKEGPNSLVFHRQAWAGALAAVGLAIVLALVIGGTSWPEATADKVATVTSELAKRLFDSQAGYVLPFEIVSVLLLAAVIGGIFLAKREDAESDIDRATATDLNLGRSPGGPSGSIAGAGLGPAPHAEEQR